MGSNRKFAKPPEGAWFNRHSETVMPEGQEAEAAGAGQHRKATSSLGCPASEGAGGLGTYLPGSMASPFQGHSVPPTVTDKLPGHLMPVAP